MEIALSSLMGAVFVSGDACGEGKIREGKLQLSLEICSFILLILAGD